MDLCLFWQSLASFIIRNGLTPPYKISDSQNYPKLNKSTLPTLLQFVRVRAAHRRHLGLAYGFYSMISIISTGSIKRTGLAIILKFLLNVPYDLIFNHAFLNVLVSIKHTGFEK